MALSILFYQEILWLLCQLFLQPKSLSTPGWDARPKASRMRAPKLLMMDFQGLESMSFRTFFGHYIFVSQSFWKELTTSEKETLYLWHTGALHQAETIRRILGRLDPSLADRNTILIGGKALDLISLIEKARDFYLSPILTLSQNCFGGLSIVGDSIFKIFEDPERRLKRLSEQWVTLKED